MIKIIKKLRKTRKVLSFLLVLTLVLGYVLSSKQEVSAKTRELSASLVQKSNPSYRSNINYGLGVVYKVEIKKKVIVIHGSLNDNHEAEAVSNIGIHTYRLAKNVKYVARGGEAPDQEFSKKDFKKYLNRSKDSGLGLALEFKNFKVTKVAIFS